MSNRLANETSPYLLQHKDNPVDWYPWCDEAFERAKKEGKPIFLSIGYSACHWCHVLAHESFEDKEIAELLNKSFISVKVDKEERPDIDSVYMRFCQAFTGSGGWPTSIFMTPEQKPFFAGTYFPKTTRGGIIGMKELLIALSESWKNDRANLVKRADEFALGLRNEDNVTASFDDDGIIHSAAKLYGRIYDEKHGGFGKSPKFPTPHNIIFLLEYYERYKDKACLAMAEHTLVQMYRGGLFDHIGFGFCRYSTDKSFLVPHFEKMLYDNAMLILAYSKAYSVTENTLYLEIAEKTADYVLRQMTSDKGGFYSSQDADSEGEEGKYYLLKPSETIKILGKEDGERFNRQFDITEKGNFENKSIPNLLKSNYMDKSFESLLSRVEDYRKGRFSLHRDEKILTAWNSLMISAMCEVYLASEKEKYLNAAEDADAFIQEHLCENSTLFVSFYLQKRGVEGFLDDYASYIFAKLALYRATLDKRHLDFAKKLTERVISDFCDNSGGFYLYGKDAEELVMRPKESYDGAIPSGNSLMAYNLVRLSLLDGEDKYRAAAERQLDFMAGEAARYPIGYAMFLTALLEHFSPPLKITVVPDSGADKQKLALTAPANAVLELSDVSDGVYSLKNEKTTYYVCRGKVCMPPVNDLNDLI